MGERLKEDAMLEGNIKNIFFDFDPGLKSALLHGD